MAKTVYLIRLDGTFARITDIVADPELVNMTGKGEPYRDTFQSSASVRDQVGGVHSWTGPMNLSQLTGAAGVITPTGTDSDDVSHEPPRQADQVYTFWKFTWATVAATPRFTYAEFRRGDIIADTAPNTDPS
jgi:hypothetical protein